MGKLQSWFLAHLPAGLVIRPHEWFIALLCFQSGLVIVAGLGEPVSVAKLLWRPVYEVWGGALVLGSALLMIGLSSIRWTPGSDMYVVKRIPAYRLGLRLLGWAAFMYAVAIAVVGQWNGAVAVAVTLAFAGACFVRLLTLGRGR